MRMILSLLVMPILITSSGHAAPPDARPMKIGIIGARQRRLALSARSDRLPPRGFISPPRGTEGRSAEGRG